MSLLNNHFVLKALTGCLISFNFFTSCVAIVRHHFITSNLRLEWFTQSGGECNDSFACTSGCVESMRCRYEATPDSKNCCWWCRNSTDRRQDINNQHNERPRRHSDCLSPQRAAAFRPLGLLEVGNFEHVWIRARPSWQNKMKSQSVWEEDYWTNWDAWRWMKQTYRQGDCDRDRKLLLASQHERCSQQPAGDLQVWEWQNLSLFDSWSLIGWVFSTWHNPNIILTLSSSHETRANQGSSDEKRWVVTNYATSGGFSSLPCCC